MDVRRHFSILGLMLTLVVMCQGQGQTMDTGFCDTIFTTKSKDYTPPPDLPTDYGFYVESLKSNAPNTVENAEEVLSLSKQKLYVNMVTNAKTDKLYVDSDSDTALMVENGQCGSKALAGSSIALSFKIKYVNGKLTIPEPKTVVLSSSVQKPMYMGSGNVRGIPTDKWQMCTYQDYANSTRAVEIHYSKYGYKMPGSEGSVPLLAIINGWNNYTKQSMHERNDFFYFRVADKKDDSFFEIPDDTWCIGRPEAWVPKMPSVFQFKTVSVDLGDPNLLDIVKHSDRYYKQTYMNPMKLFIMDVEGTMNRSDIPYHTYKAKIVHDYKTGLQYFLNQATGKCDLTKIILNDDTLASGDGTVTLKKPQQLLDLSGHNFQYMGVHKNWDRGIDADVYTSINNVSNVLSVNTWYFMAKSYQLNVLKAKVYKPVPLRFISQTVNPDGTQDKQIDDLYDYTDNPFDEDTYPNLTPCFPKGRELYLDILIDGRYDFVYLADANNFLQSFRFKLLEQTDLVSLLRVADLRVEPTQDYKILVRFTLLDKPDKVGDVINPIDEPNNPDLLQQLKDSINSGAFVLTITNGLGIYEANGVGIRQHSVKPSSFAGSLLKAKAQSKSKTYSPGAMGGLAVAMLVLGVIIGFVVFTLVLKKRVVANNESTDMQRFD